jgi:hypothetical protein
VGATVRQNVHRIICDLSREYFDTVFLFVHDALLVSLIVESTPLSSRVFVFISANCAVCFVQACAGAATEKKVLMVEWIRSLDVDMMGFVRLLGVLLKLTKDIQKPALVQLGPPLTQFILQWAERRPAELARLYSEAQAGREFVGTGKLAANLLPWATGTLKRCRISPTIMVLLLLSPRLLIELSDDMRNNTKGKMSEQTTFVRKTIKHLSSRAKSVDLDCAVSSMVCALKMCGSMACHHGGDERNLPYHAILSELVITHSTALEGVLINSNKPYTRSGTGGDTAPMDEIPTAQLVQMYLESSFFLKPLRYLGALMPMVLVPSAALSASSAAANDGALAARGLAVSSLLHLTATNPREWLWDRCCNNGGGNGGRASGPGKDNSVEGAGVGEVGIRLAVLFAEVGGQLRNERTHLQGASPLTTLHLGSGSDNDGEGGPGGGAGAASSARTWGVGVGRLGKPKKEKHQIGRAAMGTSLQQRIALNGQLLVMQQLMQLWCTEPRLLTIAQAQLHAHGSSPKRSASVSASSPPSPVVAAEAAMVIVMENAGDSDSREEEGGGSLIEAVLLMLREYLTISTGENDSGTAGTAGIAGPDAATPMAVEGSAGASATTPGSDVALAAAIATGTHERTRTETQSRMKTKSTVVSATQWSTVERKDGPKLSIDDEANMAEQALQLLVMLHRKEWIQHWPASPTADVAATSQVCRQRKASTRGVPQAVLLPADGGMAKGGATWKEREQQRQALEVRTHLRVSSVIYTRLAEALLECTMATMACTDSAPPQASAATSNSAAAAAAAAVDTEIKARLRRMQLYRSRNHAKLLLRAVSHCLRLSTQYLRPHTATIVIPARLALDRWLALSSLESALLLLLHDHHDFHAHQHAAADHITAAGARAATTVGNDSVCSAAAACLLPLCQSREILHAFIVSTASTASRSSGLASLALPNAPDDAKDDAEWRRRSDADKPPKLSTAKYRPSSLSAASSVKDKASTFGGSTRAMSSGASRAGGAGAAMIRDDGQDEQRILRFLASSGASGAHAAHRTILQTIGTTIGTAAAAAALEGGRTRAGTSMAARMRVQVRQAAWRSRLIRSMVHRMLLGQQSSPLGYTSYSSDGPESVYCAPSNAWALAFRRWRHFRAGVERALVANPEQESANACRVGDEADEAEEEEAELMGATGLVLSAARQLVSFVAALATPAMNAGGYAPRYAEFAPAHGWGLLPLQPVNDARATAAGDKSAKGGWSRQASKSALGAAATEGEVFANDGSDVEEFISGMLSLLLLRRQRAHLVQELVVHALGTALHPLSVPQLLTSLTFSVETVFTSGGVQHWLPLVIVEHALRITSLVLARTGSGEPVAESDGGHSRSRGDSGWSDNLLVATDFQTLLTACAKVLTQDMSVHLLRVSDAHTEADMMRVKQRLCTVVSQLLSDTNRADVAFSDEAAFCNSMLAVLFEWMSDFEPLKSTAAEAEDSENSSDGTLNVMENPMLRAQAQAQAQTKSDKESTQQVSRRELGENLDLACMQAICRLLHGLDLARPKTHSPTPTAAKVTKDAPSGSVTHAPLETTASRREVVRAERSELFFKYFSLLSRVLRNSGKSPELLLVTRGALGNLLKANVDVGFTHFIQAGGYHADEETRAAYLHVLSEMLREIGNFDMLREIGNSTGLLGLAVGSYELQVQELALLLVGAGMSSGRQATGHAAATNGDTGDTATIVHTQALKEANAFPLVMAICETAKSKEMEALAGQLVAIFNIAFPEERVDDEDEQSATSSGPGALRMLRHVTRREIMNAPRVQTLFRSSTMGSFLIKVVSNSKAGRAYLHFVLGPCIKSLVADSQGGGDASAGDDAVQYFELNAGVVKTDPAKAETAYQGLRTAAAQFLRRITSKEAMAACPYEIKALCAHLWQTAALRFDGDAAEGSPKGAAAQDAKDSASSPNGHIAVAGYIFLRFFCPAIVTPHTNGLVDKPPPGKALKALLLVTKALQNLANGVNFREEYLQPLNGWLKEMGGGVGDYCKRMGAPLVSAVTGERRVKSLKRTSNVVRKHMRQTLRPRPAPKKGGGGGAMGGFGTMEEGDEDEDEEDDSEPGQLQSPEFYRTGSLWKLGHKRSNWKERLFTLEGNRFQYGDGQHVKGVLSLCGGGRPVQPMADTQPQSQANTSSGGAGNALGLGSWERSANNISNLAPKSSRMFRGAGKATGRTLSASSTSSISSMKSTASLKVGGADGSARDCGVSVQPLPDEARSPRHWRFELVTATDQHLVMSASSEAERTGWMTILHAAATAVADMPLPSQAQLQAAADGGASGESTGGDGLQPRVRAPSKAKQQQIDRAKHQVAVFSGRKSSSNVSSRTVSAASSMASHNDQEEIDEQEEDQEEAIQEALEAMARVHKYLIEKRVEVNAALEQGAANITSADGTALAPLTSAAVPADANTRTSSPLVQSGGAPRKSAGIQRRRSVAPRHRGSLTMRRLSQQPTLQQRNSQRMSVMASTLESTEEEEESSQSQMNAAATAAVTMAAVTAVAAIHTQTKYRLDHLLETLPAPPTRLLAAESKAAEKKGAGAAGTAGASGLRKCNEFMERMEMRYGKLELGEEEKQAGNPKAAKTAAIADTAGDGPYLSLAALQASDVFYQRGKGKSGRPLFYFIMRRLVPHSMDMDLLLYVVLGMLKHAGCLGNGSEAGSFVPFELVVDCTLMSADHRLALAWFKKLMLLLPPEILVAGSASTSATANTPKGASAKGASSKAAPKSAPTGVGLCALYVLRPSAATKQIGRELSKAFSLGVREKRRMRLLRTPEELAEFVPAVEGEEGAGKAGGAVSSDSTGSAADISSSVGALPTDSHMPFTHRFAASWSPEGTAVQSSSSAITATDDADSAPMSIGLSSHHTPPCLSFETHDTILGRKCVRADSIPLLAIESVSRPTSQRSWRAVHPHELVIKCYPDFHPSLHANQQNSTALSAGALVFFCPQHEQLLPLLRQTIGRVKQEVEIKETSRLADQEARTFHPSDVPGTLLHLGLLNLGSTAQQTRNAAYNLCVQLYFHFNMHAELPLAGSAHVTLPANTLPFVVKTSEALAKTEPHFTFEFLRECLHSLQREGLPMRLKLLCIEYMIPWLRNLARFADRVVEEGGKEIDGESDGNNSDSQEGEDQYAAEEQDRTEEKAEPVKSKSTAQLITECLRSLIEATADQDRDRDHSVYISFVNLCWREVGRNEELTALAVSCLIDVWQELELQSRGITMTRDRTNTATMVNSFLATTSSARANVATNSSSHISTNSSTDSTAQAGSGISGNRRLSRSRSASSAASSAVVQSASAAMFSIQMYAGRKFRKSSAAALDSADVEAAVAASGGAGDASASTGVIAGGGGGGGGGGGVKGGVLREALAPSVTADLEGMGSSVVGAVDPLCTLMTDDHTDQLGEHTEQQPDYQYPHLSNVLLDLLLVLAEEQGALVGAAIVGALADRIHAACFGGDYGNVDARDNPYDIGPWCGVIALCRPLLALSFGHPSLVLQHLPTLFHLIVTVVGCGPTIVCAAIHAICTNVVHALLAAPESMLPDRDAQGVGDMLAKLSQPHFKAIFFGDIASDNGDSNTEGVGGARNGIAQAEPSFFSMQADDRGYSSLAQISSLVSLLLQTMDLLFSPAFPHWARRWLELTLAVTNNRSARRRGRAFITLGLLAQKLGAVEVALVPLLTGELRFALEATTSERGTAGAEEPQCVKEMTLLAIVRCLAQLVEVAEGDVGVVKRKDSDSAGERPTDVYMRLFWPLVAMLQLAGPLLFASTAELLEAVLLKARAVAIEQLPQSDSRLLLSTGGFAQSIVLGESNSADGSPASPTSAASTSPSSMLRQRVFALCPTDLCHALGRCTKISFVHSSGEHRERHFGMALCASLLRGCYHVRTRRQTFSLLEVLQQDIGLAMAVRTVFNPLGMVCLDGACCEGYRQLLQPTIAGSEQRASMVSVSGDAEVEVAEMGAETEGKLHDTGEMEMANPAVGEIQTAAGDRLGGLGGAIMSGAVDHVLREQLLPASHAREQAYGHGLQHSLASIESSSRGSSGVVDGGGSSSSSTGGDPFFNVDNFSGSAFDSDGGDVSDSTSSVDESVGDSAMVMLMGTLLATIRNTEQECQEERIACCHLLIRMLRCAAGQQAFAVYRGSALAWLWQVFTDPPARWQSHDPSKGRDEPAQMASAVGGPSTGGGAQSVLSELVMQIIVLTARPSSGGEPEDGGGDSADSGDGKSATAVEGFGGLLDAGAFEVGALIRMTVHVTLV